MVWLNQFNLILLSSFIDRDMLMRYHWGLGIGHAYVHTTVASPNSKSHSSFPSSEPPNSSKHDTDNCRHDKINEGDIADESELLEFEPDSESGSESHSDLESVLGDHADMYGWGSDLDGSGHYEF